MLEKVLVEMLRDAGGGEVLDPADEDLARAAARWAEQAGWQLHLHNSFFFEVQALLSVWILLVRSTQTLEIRVRLSDQPGWETHARHRIAHLGHGLEVLVAEGLIPARYSPVGHRALAEFATAIDRVAGQFGRLADETTPAEIEEFGKHYPWEMRIRSATLHQVADQARAFPHGALAVTT